MRAGEPGAEAMGTIAGALPRTLAAMSRASTGVILSEATGPSASAEARPSVNGHWDTAARSSGCREATVMAWPPPKELPHTAMRERSTSGRALT
ncbi:hypothetical protein SAFG77S_00994 [Streptomyces afghaniensis]